MTPSAFEHLSPAYPGKAPWGTASRLRAWQESALSQYLNTDPRDFLCVATPGAGKTTFALRIARELLSARTVRRVIVVAPTEHLKVQWADAAAKVGIQLDPGLGGSKRGRSRDYDGLAVTYAGVAMRPYHYEALVDNKSSLVILDEIHHAGDSKSWGDAVSQAFRDATRRLSLTGTPFRSDDSPIPFVTYEPGPGNSMVSSADFTYGYADALADHVVRPVVFMNYGGPMRWRTTAGDEVEANLGEMMTKDLTAHAWRTALDPRGEWISAVLAAADRRLTEVRRHIPDAGGLVIASNQSTARAYAQLLSSVTGQEPALVLSDDPGSSARITSFSESEERWMVAVRMVSEGVDVPRLCVGVYATATSTPLFFAQAVGRFVRTRRRGELATVFLPTVPIVLAHASAMERQRDHVLGLKKSDPEAVWDESLVEAANRSEAASDDLLGTFEPLASDAIFDHVLFDGDAFGMHSAPQSQDENDYLGLPGLLEPQQVSALLQERQRRQLARRAKTDRREAREQRDSVDNVALHRQLADLRKQLNTLVSQHARTSGTPHGHVHAELRRQCGGAKLAECNPSEVQRRIDLIRTWR